MSMVAERKMEHAGETKRRENHDHALCCYGQHIANSKNDSRCNILARTQGAGARKCETLLKFQHNFCN